MPRYKTRYRDDGMSVPTTVREPRSGWQPINWRELLGYRDLLFFLVLRDIRGRYAQTVIGFGWAVIRPLFSMVVFSVVFGKLARIPSDGIPYPVFSFAALVPWTYFSTAMTQSTGSLISNANLWTKVYFPRLVIPLTPALAGLVDFSIAFVMLGILMLFFGIAPTSGVLVLPYLVLLMFITSAGVGMWLSSLAIKYRDVNHAIPFVAQILLYAAPVVWPMSLIGEQFPQWDPVIRQVYGLYPITGVIEGFRSGLLGTGPMPWDLIASGTVGALVVFVSGAFYFRRMERTFADVA
ncbi:MAG TPA: ABC transporter permease [Gemmatimonadota bacterium]|nr:ABC transporter permease [Gemmatimonadota bacterium]